MLNEFVKAVSLKTTTLQSAKSEHQWKKVASYWKYSVLGHEDNELMRPYEIVVTSGASEGRQPLPYFVIVFGKAAIRLQSLCRDPGSIAHSMPVDAYTCLRFDVNAM